MFYLSIIRKSNVCNAQFFHQVTANTSVLFNQVLQDGNTGNKVSNFEKCVDGIINYASRLAAMWNSGGYAEKEKLQFSAFPEGILYNRKNDECHPPV